MEAPMEAPSPEDLLVWLKQAHARERLLVAGLDEDTVRGPAALPGWTRGHVLASRLVFLRAAIRQVDYVLDGRSIEFYEGGRQGHEAGRAGRDAAIEQNVRHPADVLTRDASAALSALDACWSRVGPSDWERRTEYREGTLTDLLLGCWRESEMHLVDFDLGVRPSDWSVEFCAHLFDFLSRRGPENTRIELTTPDGRTWPIGAGDERVQVHGELTDLAAWLAGRRPEGIVESSTGSLPELRRGTGRQGTSRSRGEG